MTDTHKAESSKEYLIKPLNGRVIMPDDAADQQVKNFIVRYKESVLVKDFLQMIAVANIGGQKFEVHAVEDITVIMEDKENGVDQT